MSTIASRFDGIKEAQLVRTYVSAKGWRTMKIKTIEHIIESLNIKFNLSSYHRLQSELLPCEMWQNSLWIKIPHWHGTTTENLWDLKRTIRKSIAWTQSIAWTGYWYSQQVISPDLRKTWTYGYCTSATSRGTQTRSFVVLYIHSTSTNLERSLPLAPQS